ncbi:hypothetical protein V9K67_27080 [Paraflavisolibacter sp. H34]|uniref:hypothetical protein n=1 Tax=Huijunlia imazamoxiresistens TaxID=3127457 RepID=UPI003016764A
MQFSLRSNFDRISHHDAHVTNIATHNDRLELSFDWGYIESFDSIGNIVIGDNTLILNAVTDQRFYRWEDSGRVEIQKPVIFESLISLVSQCTFVETGSGIIFTLGGLLEPPIDDYYVEWEISCKSAELKWDKYITHAEWESGAIP